MHRFVSLMPWACMAVTHTTLWDPDRPLNLGAIVHGMHSDDQADKNS
jgi:hypothetical protein